MVETTIPVTVSRQDALARELSLIAHNLANQSTTGYRAERMLFDEALRKAGAAEPVSFVVDRASYLEERPGPIETTERPFDAALDGDGWFSLETAQGLRYTRDGRFHRNETGQLVTLDGHNVLDETGGPILLEENVRQFVIATDGELTADGLGIGRLGVVRFPDDQRLLREAGGLYRAENNAEGQPATNVRVLQGALEGANVDPILEITRLMEASRAYEQSARSNVDTHNLKRSAIERLGAVR